MSALCIYGCRWAWCRLNFADNDALRNHVVFEHVRRAVPVRRRDLSMARRVEEGLGDSLKISDIMHDPSSSLSQKSELSKVPASSQQLPSSSSLPSPPTSSPLLPPQDQTIPEDIEQRANSTDVHPTFASFSSPAGSIASLNIPTSPAFSTLVHRKNKRKEASDSLQECLGKRPKQHFLPQESASAASTGSDRSVEEQLTQTSGEDDDDDSGANAEADARDDEYIVDSQADLLREDVVMIPPTSGTSSSLSSLMLESSQQGAYNGELNGHVLSPPFPTHPSLRSSHERSANPFLESMSQPPSQLQLSSPLYHIHRPKSSPRTTQIDTTSSVLSFPLNPVALSSPLAAGFRVSTPQRQTWYQPSLRRRVSSKSSSGETTPKLSSRKHEPTGTLPTVSEEKRASSVQDQVPSTPVRGSPLARKSVFRSGTLRVTHPSESPLHSQSPSRPQSMASQTNADASLSALVRDIFTPPEEKFDSCDTQDQQSPLFEDTSYPPLQTQAPYQSQSFSQ